MGYLVFNRMRISFSQVFVRASVAGMECGNVVGPEHDLER